MAAFQYETSSVCARIRNYAITRPHSFDSLVWVYLNMYENLICLFATKEGTI